MNLLLAQENTSTLVFLIILVVACIALFVVNTMRNRKYMEQQKEMLDNIEVGSKILTKTFMYGTVEKITETTDGKILLIKTGEDDKVGYFEINIEGVYSLDKKEEVVDLPEDETAEDEVEETEAAETEVEEEATEAFKAESDVKTEEKPKRTRKSKKSE